MKPRQRTTPPPDPIPRTQIGKRQSCPCLPGSCEARTAQTCKDWTKRKQDKR